MISEVALTRLYHLTLPRYDQIGKIQLDGIR
jgi:hypothetical protein